MAGRQAGSQSPTVWSLLWWTSVPGDPVALAFSFHTIYHMAGLWWICPGRQILRWLDELGGLNLEPWAGEL